MYSLLFTGYFHGKTCLFLQICNKPITWQQPSAKNHVGTDRELHMTFTSNIRKEEKPITARATANNHSIHQRCAEKHFRMLNLDSREGVTTAGCQNGTSGSSLFPVPPSATSDSCSRLAGDEVFIYRSHLAHILSTVGNFTYSCFGENPSSAVKPVLGTQTKLVVFPPSDI